MLKVFNKSNVHLKISVSTPEERGQSAVESGSRTVVTLAVMLAVQQGGEVMGPCSLGHTVGLSHAFCFNIIVAVLLNTQTFHKHHNLKV